MKLIEKSQFKSLYRVGSTTAYMLLQNQIAILKKMSHTNIAPLFEMIIDPSCDQVLLITDYEPPRNSLWDALEQGLTLDEEKMRTYFRQLVSGLDYCHNVVEIVHRNIKLENILISVDNAQLAEAGQSFLLENEESCKMEYNAPEISNKGTYKNAKSDIWALGVCLYYMGERCFPFATSNVDLTKHGSSITCAQLSFKHIINSDLKDLLEKMLAKDPFKRITLSQLKVICCFCNEKRFRRING